MNKIAVLALAFLVGGTCVQAQTIRYNRAKTAQHGIPKNIPPKTYYWEQVRKIRIKEVQLQNATMKDVALFLSSEFAKENVTIPILWEQHLDTQNNVPSLRMNLAMTDVTALELVMTVCKLCSVDMSITNRGIVFHPHN